MEQLTLKVTIDGILTPCTDVRTDHDTDQPIGTGTLVIPGSRPVHVEPSAVVRVEVGWGDALRTIFQGSIGDDSTAFSESGGVTRVAIEGWGKRLWYANHADQFIAGPVALHTVFNQFCISRGVLYYYADYTVHAGGEFIMLGGNAKIDDGKVIVPANSSPGDVIDRLGRLFGYRAFDQPSGFHRLLRISGLPVGEPFRTYVEGVHFHDVQRSRTLKSMVNYWEILGASYTASDGSTVAIRSTPAGYVSDPRLGPSGISHKSIRDEALITTLLADSCRNTMEIDFGAPQHRWGWTVAGDGEVLPGHVVTVESPTVGGTADLWLTHVSHVVSMQGGWTTSMEGWAGNGEALPAGDDCVSQTLLGPGGKHLGNEYLDHYKRPNPDGLSVSIPFTVVDNYSSLTISGEAHGTNSFVGNTTSTASRFEIWQGGESVASGEMPRQNENLEQRLDYSNNSNWQSIVIPLSGSLEAGSAQLRILSGLDSSVGDQDDFEVKNLVLRTCGVGSPEVIV